MSECCELCRSLQVRAAAAITRQVALFSQRDIARMRGEHWLVAELLPLLDVAQDERDEAVGEYLDHIAIHNSLAQRAGE